MGACYGVNIKVCVMDEAGAVNALNKHMKKSKIQIIC